MVLWRRHNEKLLENARREGYREGLTKTLREEVRIRSAYIERWMDWYDSIPKELKLQLPPPPAPPPVDDRE